ncbi:MAG: exo-beta-N-acetylmuramidase NamZ domain-containing protein [Bacteroidota bacterium]
MFKLKFLAVIFILSAASLGAKVKPGIDVLIQNGFDEIRGKKIALLTNFSGRTSDGRLTAEVLSESDEFELSAIFTPEHGFYTAVPAGLKVEDESFNQIPILSMYGASKSPSQSVLSEIDALLIDIQDIGIRSYTFLSSVYRAMEACAEIKKTVIILDRPNPIGGMIADGSVLDTAYRSFVGIIPVSYIHGCTLGELALMIIHEGWLGNGRQCEVKVIQMDGWQRWMAWEDTGLGWYPTSPHIPTPGAIRGAAALGTFGELGIISIGIGTTLPFQYIGQPGLRVNEIEKSLGVLSPGFHLSKTKYRPFYGMYSSKYCDGFLITFSLSNEFRPYTDGIRLMLAIRRTHPTLFSGAKLKDNARQMFIKVTGSEKLYELMFSGAPDEKIIEAANEGLIDFLKLRGKYLLY